MLVEQKPLSVRRDFKPMAERRENLPSKAALEDETHSTLEREFWKKVTYNPPTYCADVAGTLFDKDNWGWNVSKLDSLLSRTLRRKGVTLDGVNSSYLYFGMWRSLFAWHTEDMDLYSVNYLHYGAPKFWYAVAPEDRERFEILAQGMVPEMWRACPEFLRHKELLISPTLLEQNGIPFTRMMQHPGEFVVTYPGSYHSGFNTGYNCAESCNFATEAWVEIGEDAGVCECVPDAVSLDMSIFDDNVCARVDEDDYTAVKRGRVGAVKKREGAKVSVANAPQRRGGADGLGESDSEQPSASGRSRRDEAPTDARRGNNATAKAHSASKRRADAGGKENDPSSKRSRCGGSQQQKKSDGSGSDSDPSKPPASPPARLRRSGQDRVLVPEGWTRSIVMRGPDGAAPQLGPGRPKSAPGDRDTYYRAPTGESLKSKYEVNKYLQSHPNELARARDFFFECKPEDRPPARLVAPGTPSASGEETEARVLPRGGGGSRSNKSRKATENAAAANAAASREKETAATAPGATTSARDALGSLLSPSKGGSRVVVTGFERDCASEISADRFAAWTSRGLLETAVAKVLRRAGTVGKSIRGSSLVTQVEQALGVGTGVLRGHGGAIKAAAANSRTGRALSRG